MSRDTLLHATARKRHKRGCAKLSAPSRGFVLKAHAARVAIVQQRSLAETTRTTADRSDSACLDPMQSEVENWSRLFSCAHAKLANWLYSIYPFWPFL